jgi:hypothetical protein
MAALCSVDVCALCSYPGISFEFGILVGIWVCHHCVLCVVCWPPARKFCVAIHALLVLCRWGFLHNGDPILCYQPTANNVGHRSIHNHFQFAFSVAVMVEAFDDEAVRSSPIISSIPIITRKRRCRLGNIQPIGSAANFIPPAFGSEH